MTILEMLEQSGILTLFGIGLVFAFLIIMIIVISQAGKIFSARETGRDAGKAAGGGGNKGGASNNAAVTAAIVAAVGAYRKSSKKG